MKLFSSDRRHCLSVSRGKEYFSSLPLARRGAVGQAVLLAARAAQCYGLRILISPACPPEEPPRSSFHLVSPSIKCFCDSSVN